MICHRHPESGTRRALSGIGDDSREVQISAPVQSGNSGGPLLDMGGNIIGVVASKLDALKVAARSHEIEEADYKALTAHGFTEDDAWDIAAIAAFYAMSNRLANAFSIRPNDEFYLMGREARR